MNYQNLSFEDEELFAIIKKENKRQEDELELIASENYVSSAVLEAMGTILTNKYSEGYPCRRYYGGNENIDDLELLTISRAKELFLAEHVNVQPLSGSPANAAVYMAFLKPGDKVLGLKLDHGGHLSHGHDINFSGQLYNFVQYGVDSETGLIDMVKLREIAKRERPKMIVAGFSAYSRDINWQEFKDIADEIGAYTFADIAHIAGLIAGKQLENPVPIFDVVSSTTHKTLRGPRGAIIMCKQKFAKQVDRAVFPGMQGGPHDHITAAKAVAFAEALRPDFRDYSRQVILNAKCLVMNLIKLGYEIVSHGTDNHLFVINLVKQNISGKEAEKALESAGISVSRSTVPNEQRSPLDPSGLRIGSPAITTRGMKEPEMELIASYINEALLNKDNEKELLIIKEKVKNICSHFPLPTKNIKY